VPSLAATNFIKITIASPIASRNVQMGGAVSGVVLCDLSGDTRMNHWGRCPTASDSLPFNDRVRR
jgi:hypothetical protein